MRKKARWLLVVGCWLAGCGSAAYASPQPVDASVPEEALLAYARQFNPAMFFAGADLWPVEVNYCWHDGSPLMGAVLDAKKRPLREWVALEAERLDREKWDHLPWEENGEKIIYYVDCPGDNLGPGENEETWSKAFRRIQGNMDDPTLAAYPPTQYVHIYWWDKAKGELAIAYWFYYPYDKWMNNHEGDWEHIQVVVAADEGLTDAENAKPLRFHYQHHGFGEWWKSPPVFLFKDRGKETGYHPGVWVGGKATPKLFKPWTGLYSGGSYPGPQVYNLLIVEDDTSVYRRAIHPNDFKLILLREKEEMRDRLDERPDLSWIFLPVYFGQLAVEANHEGVIKAGGHTPPSHPLMRRSLKEGPRQKILDTQMEFLPVAFPPGWELR